MTLPQPPASLSRTERRAFRSLVKRIAAAGIDAHGRADLAADYVALEARLADLRSREREAEGKTKDAATRALNVATAERRRLHAALFAGVKDAPAEAPEIAAAKARQSEADAAWRAFLYAPDRFREDETWEEREAREAPERAALEARYGKPRMFVLIFETPEEEAEAYRAIAAYNRRHRQVGLRRGEEA